ncbi:MAG: hypothetical protein HQL03_04330 [Nitrospirae bacterium]|nr:hypothetical protein [Nitrospirota bacterium]MBF0592368.1 hypothetical protein [Nitrospirota bacterium]
MLEQQNECEEVKPSTEHNLEATSATVLCALEKPEAAQDRTNQTSTAIDGGEPPISQVSKKMQDLKLIDAYIERHRDLLLKLAKC